MPPRRAAWLLGACLLAASCAPEGAETGTSADAAAESPSDSAQMIAERLMTSLGGEEAWEENRFLRFRWIVSRDTQVLANRLHAWDRWEGDYRLEYDRGDGSHVLALFNVQNMRSDEITADEAGTGEGAAGAAAGADEGGAEANGDTGGNVWVDGRRLEGAARDSALENAYGAFINDTYWLLMPFKWQDPGVHLAYEGMRTLDDGESYQVVHLTFDTGLGITEDQYWAFVDPETGRMAAWQYHLEGQEEKGAVIWWRDWRQVGNLMLATDRRPSEGGFRIHFEDLAASPEVPEGAFQPPAS